MYEKNMMHIITINPAVPVRDEYGNIVAREYYSDDSDNPYIFAMRDDKNHEFTLELLTLLECLRLSEEEGHVPLLPGAWWIQLANRYNLRWTEKGISFK
jgi:hypothetical protein